MSAGKAVLQKGFALFALFAIFGAVPALAQSVRRVAPDRVSVKAVAAPAGDVLAELIAIEPIKSVGLEPRISTPVTVTAENITPLEAIVLVLKATDLDFVLSKTLVVSRTRRVVEAPREPPRQFREPDIAERPSPPLDPDGQPDPPPPPRLPIEIQ